MHLFVILEKCSQIFWIDDGPCLASLHWQVSQCQPQRSQEMRCFLDLHVSKERLKLSSLLLVCTPFLEKLLTWLIQPTMLAISRRFCHFLGATSSAIIFPLCFLCSLYVSFPYLGYASIVIKLSWDFAGPYGNWEFLHSFNCYRHYYRNYCYVPNPEAQLPWWNQQPIGVAHWWHPYCYAHCAFCHHGHWFTQTLTTGSGFLLTCSSLCYSTRSILHVWARAHKPC